MLPYLYLSHTSFNRTGFCGFCETHNRESAYYMKNIANYSIASHTAPQGNVRIVFICHVKKPSHGDLEFFVQVPITAELRKWPVSPRAWILSTKPHFSQQTKERTVLSPLSPLSTPTLWTCTFSVVNYCPRTSLSSLRLLYFSPSLQDFTTSSISTECKIPKGKTNLGESAIQKAHAHTHAGCSIEFEF